MVAAALVGGGVPHKTLVNFHDAGSLGVGTAAPAHEYVHVSGGHVVAAQKIQKHLLAHRHLVVGGGVLQQHRGVVEDALSKNVFFVLKVAYLGGGGAGIDDQQFGFHGNDLLLCVFIFLNRMVSFYEKTPPDGVVVSMIFGIENHRYPSHYDLPIKMFHSTE